MEFKIGEVQEAFGTIEEIKKIGKDQIEVFYSTNQKVVYEFDVNFWSRINIVEL